MNLKLKKRFWFLTVLLTLMSALACFAQTGELIAEVEAEDGVLTGVRVENSIAGFSGNGYVTGFDNGNDKVTVKVQVPQKAFYQIIIRYHSNDFKSQNLSINGGGATGVDFQASNGFADANGGKHILNPGENTISIQNSWGWTEIDKFSIYTTSTNSYENTKTGLVDPLANTATRSLYNFLLSQYGNRIISGQTDSYFNELKAIAGKTPMYRVWDFQHYTEGYSYNWEDGGFAFGIDKGTRDTENAIAWYNSTEKKGIVGFQWHWHSPVGGTVGTNTFYNENTTFDVKKAVLEGTNEYQLAIRDIDAIAAELQKLENAGVPVLFRPLHEAGGGWFWWSGNTDAASAAACVKLYNIIYDRLNNYHQIHNLIWTWSTYEEEFFPGNDKVDIVGMDSYPGVNNYSTQKNTFDRYFDLTVGESLIAMTENGPIPDPDDCLDLDAPWSFFMSWGSLVDEQNERSHIKSVFNNARVLTIENDTFPLIISSEDAFFCESGIATLKAHANFGKVNWYAEASGGNILHTGTSFETPEISNTTSYYVEASNSGLPVQIARIAVTVFIRTPLKSSAITGKQEVCQGESELVYALPIDDNAESYSWTLPLEASVSGDISNHEIVVNYGLSAESGLIKVQAQNDCGLGPINEFEVVVRPLPTSPVIELVDGVLLSNVSEGNNWYFNGGIIANEMQDKYTPVENGYYYSIIIQNACSSQASNTVTYIKTEIEYRKTENARYIYPNPLKGNQTFLTLSGLKMNVDYEVNIFDLKGDLRYHGISDRNQIHINQLSQGQYLIQLTGDSKTITQKLVIK